MLDDVPDTIIQSDQMIDILVDIHLAESAAPVLKTDSIKPEHLMQSYYSIIFEHHTITQSKFENSFQYYTEHPLVLNYIYQKVVEKLNLMESAYKPAKDTTQKNTPFKPNMQQLMDENKQH